MKKPDPKTVKRNKEIVKAVKAKRLNFSSAAKKYGVSRQYVQQICEAEGVKSPYKAPTPKKKRTVDEYQKEKTDAALAHAKKVERYYDEGEPLGKIAKRFGVEETTMRNFVSRWRNKKPGMFKKRKGE